LVVFLFVNNTPLVTFVVVVTRMKTLAKADPHLWSTPNRIATVEDAVRQWSTLQLFANTDEEQQARMTFALEQHVHAFLCFSIPDLPQIYSDTLCPGRIVRLSKTRLH
jgi:hypothetical protein